MLLQSSQVFVILEVDHHPHDFGCIELGKISNSQFQNRNRKSRECGINPLLRMSVIKLILFNYFGHVYARVEGILKMDNHCYEKERELGQEQIIGGLQHCLDIFDVNLSFFLISIFCTKLLRYCFQVHLWNSPTVSFDVSCLHRFTSYGSPLLFNDLLLLYILKFDRISRNLCQRLFPVALL